MSFSAAQLATFAVPKVDNEPNQHYAPKTPARVAVESTLKDLSSSLPIKVPAVIDGASIAPSGPVHTVPIPHDHANAFVEFSTTPIDKVQAAIDSALAYKPTWESIPWADKAAIFLKAAELVSGKYRAQICAYTMLGQGKNIWQAEIDAAAELTDFLRFGVKYAEEMYIGQPPKNSPGIWNRTEYRPLDGFVFAISPFNFTAIGGNLVGIPALLSNVCVWKPSPSSLAASHLVHKIFLEAGLPPKVIQFVVAPNGKETEDMVASILNRKELAGIHFTGSTHVFRSLWKQVAMNMDNYISYPRIVGETGGKNFHLVHQSADLRSTVIQSIRAGFEYQGQKCSALSRLYVPRSLWEKGFKDTLVQEAKKITVGPPHEFQHFMGPLIHKGSFDKVVSFIEKAKASGGEVLVGGTSNASKGYYVDPTVIVTKDPKSVTMTEEIFGPVITVYVYQDQDWQQIVDLVDQTSIYALTGSVFATDREAIVYATQKLRHAAGNFYINDKCTGAVVGQQPFGGSRGSGTNDKAGSINLLYRFVNARSIKENFINPEDFAYPSNQV
ncbi:delta-1-pyrroline-5-carboxylate dehydrogenase [Atractiella rhizophila]|nr:delta-1-pyrroline-5-carboxylate dehydrogenase [Atractiella rhizophila]